MVLSGVCVRNEKIATLGVTLPQFVEREKVIAQLPSLSLLIIAALTPKDVEIDYVEVPDVERVEQIKSTQTYLAQDHRGLQAGSVAAVLSGNESGYVRPVTNGDAAV